MKKFQFLSVIILTIGLLFGCANDTVNEAETADNNSSEVQTETIQVTISKDNEAEVISEKEIDIEEGDILMDVMKENFDIEEDGGFITSIDGIAPEEGEQKAWMYFVNGEMAMVGATEYELAAGDEVTFDLQAWE